ncbi:MAG TPA: ABC transporter ATP-binding protein [Longimicrobiales bacterium]
MSATFETRSLSVRYPHAAGRALDAVNARVVRGSFCAVIGPNGSGKSTLIKALLGALSPEAGSVLFDGKPLPEWSRRELVLRIGAVAQSEEMPFPVSVRDLVAMGRYPKLGALRSEQAADRDAIERALRRCDVQQLSDRSVASLSGGELQRARIARALAQEPSTLVLDEPTVALDVAHEMVVFELLRSLCRVEGWTVLVATHHLNLAARYADELMLLDAGRLVIAGAPAAVMRQDVLEDVYGWPVLLHQHTGPGFDSGAPQITPLSRS